MYPSYRIRLPDVHVDDGNLEEIGGKFVLTDSGGYGYPHRELEMSTRLEEECLLECGQIFLWSLLKKYLTHMNDKP